MIPASTRMCLGSAVVAGLLLASSFTVSASSQTDTANTITCSSMKPMLASSIMPSRLYTEAVRKQTLANLKTEADSALAKSIATANDAATVATQTTVQVAAQPPKQVEAQPVKKAEVQPVKSKTKAVQVAASPQTQVSRSDNSSLVNNALSLVGVPYLFGGTSRSGFDCSGYTQYVFKGSGISLPRTAAGQFSVGSSVNRDQLQSGDLVFFSTYDSGASHVGIYIGGGSFVHASNSGVRTSSLSESYYASRYLGARRVR